MRRTAAVLPNQATRWYEEMKKIGTDYMYGGKWTDEFLRLNSTDYRTEQSPEITELKDAVILPARESSVHAWGSGGAVDSDGQLAEASRLGTIFGEAYPYSRTELMTLNESVYYIPVIPKHWGHFLIDILCRFWFVLDGKDLGYRIAYCSNDFEEGLTGNYLEALELLGINKSRLIMVTRPTQFSEVLIPGKSFGDGAPYCEKYLSVVNRIKEQVFRTDASLLPDREDRIYFTRTKFRRSKYTEVGEERIEKLFRENGFTVLSPERLTVREQVFYFSTCKEIASLSGTIGHQIVFSEPGNQYYNLNRCCLLNYAQLAVNQMSSAEITYIDVYAKETLKKPQYWPVWVEANHNLSRFFRDRSFPVTDYKPIEAAVFKLVDFIHFKYLFLRLRIKAFVGRT